MQALLYAEISKKTLSETLKGGSFSFGKLTQGDTMTLGFRWCQRVEGEPFLAARTLTALRASIGPRDARPVAGQTRFQIGNPATTPETTVNLTAPLGFNFSAADLQQALNELSSKPGVATVTEDAGTFVISFAGATGYTTITARNNRLRPFTLAEPEYYLEDGEYLCALRLKQTPAAFTNAFDAVLPPPPVITEVQAGFSDASTSLSEVQKIHLPPAFRGSYILKRAGKESPALTESSNLETLTAAFASIADAGGEFTLLELAGQNAYHIIFGGDMIGINQPLIEVEVVENPAGDPTLTLDLGKANMSAYLRGAKNGEIKLPLEIEASFENLADSSKTDKVTWMADVTIVAEVSLASLASPANIDFLRPPSPINYEVSGEDQSANGYHRWSGPRGDGVSTVFVIDHNRDSELVLPVIRQNTANGEILKLGVDYDINLNNANSLTVTMKGDYLSTPPTTNELLIYILAFGLASQYDAHTHSRAEIDGLQAILDGLAAGIAALQAAIPIGAGAADEAATTNATITLGTMPQILEAFPARQPIAAAADAATKAAPALADLDLSTLPSDGGILPAVHDAKVESLTLPLPAASVSLRGKVFVLGGSTDITLPGGGGRKSTILRPGEYATCDGRYWYRVIRHADTESTWYPYDFSRELAIFAVTDKDLSLRRKIEFPIGFECAIMTRRGITPAELQRTAYKNTRCQWQIVYEWGTFTSEAAAAGVPFIANAGSDLITASIDNVPNGTPVKLSTTGTLPAPLTAGMLCYTRDTSGNDRKLALTNGGTAIDITDAGTGVHTLTPQTASANLKGITWHSTPLLAHTFQLTRVASSRSYNVRILRRLIGGVDTLSAEQVIMGNASAAGSVPASANFVVRVMLGRFDSEDGVVDPRSLIVFSGLNREVITGEIPGSITLKSV